MGYICIKDGSRECDGCMTCKDGDKYFCPVCGREVYEIVYVNNEGDVIGCENCAQIKEPWEMISDDDEGDYE